MNSSWEQNASAANDSGDWGGWSSGGGAAAKPANPVTGAAKETILGDPQGDRMRGVHLHQDNGLN